MVYVSMRFWRDYYGPAYGTSTVACPAGMKGLTSLTRYVDDRITVGWLLALVASLLAAPPPPHYLLQQGYLWACL